MAASTKRAQLLQSSEGDVIRHALAEMSADDSYITESNYTSDSEAYPDNLMPFVDWHMDYLIRHADVNPSYYLSNLRLMLRVRR